MTYTVELVQRGISANTHPVSGKSGKLYGNAVASPKDGGVVFRMSLQDYFKDAHDLCGNTAAGQQWVPIFVEDASSKAVRPKCDRCSKPSVAIWDRFPFCADHAPANASWYDENERPASSQPVESTATPAGDAPRVDERLTNAPTEEVELPREVLAPPVMGTTRETEEEPSIPPALRVPPPAAPAAATVNESATAKDSVEAAAQPPAKAVTAVEAITAGVVKAVMPQIEQRFEEIRQEFRANGSDKPTPRVRRKPAQPEKAPTEFQRVQREAKALGINLFGKGKEQLQKEIAEHGKPTEAINPDPKGEPIAAQPE